MDRKSWNAQQQQLRQALAKKDTHEQAVVLFMQQHAQVHCAEMSGAGEPTFEDEVWQGLSEDGTRIVPEKEEHSIAWLFWHLTRIEDATMNVLLAGRPQMFIAEGWQARLGVTVSEVGNAMSPAEMADLSAALDIQALRAYRVAVGRRTRENVRTLPVGAFKRKVDPAGLERLLAEGAVNEGSRWLLDYWGGLTLGGLLLMPPTRHCLVHINEALSVKKRL
ncbi:MAG: DinB family protein [Anaerolineaceae bacterium]|nr:DinB family protein [Anaerolineaceae bacterium]